MTSVERVCVQCGSSFRGATRQCSACQVRERQCTSCGCTFSSRYRKCPTCRNVSGICQLPGCEQPKVPGHGSKLCQEHRDTAYERKLERLRSTTCSMPGCTEPKIALISAKTGRFRPFRYCEKHSGERRQRERLQIVRRKYEREYGITHDEFLAMLDAQGGVCAICKNGNGKRAMNVDHDHVTGVVRALLCDRCNPMLGYARDDIAILQKAIEYLMKFSQ